MTDWQPVAKSRGKSTAGTINVGSQGRIGIALDVMLRLGDPQAVVLLRDDQSGAFALRAADDADPFVIVRRITRPVNGVPLTTTTHDVPRGRYTVDWQDGMAVFGPKPDEPANGAAK